MLLSTAALANPVSVDPEYSQCLQNIDVDAEGGRKQALRWISDGGGDPALHCAAMGDLAISRPLMAAGRLDYLAKNNRTKDPYLAATLYVQAAQAWSSGGSHEEAIASITEAKNMAPGSSDIDLLAAPIFAEAGRWGLVKRALDNAETFDDLNAQALVLRARAKRELSDFEGAAKDLQSALNLDPENIQGLVLRGELTQAGYVIIPYAVQ